MKRESSSADIEDNKKQKKDHPFFNMKKTVQWLNAVDTVLIAKTKGIEVSRNKVAAFDLDGTLITTKSGNTYAKNENDWKWWDASVPEKIKSLYKEGFKIVVFSNQNGLNTDKSINSFKFKVEAIMDQVNTPMLVMAALKKNVYRKPMMGMWDWFVQDNHVAIDKSLCFYVGDAAGRPANWKPKYKKDHSCCDRKFADNIQIKFYTPEEYFLNEPKAEFSWGEFNPKEHLTLDVPIHTPSDTMLVNTEPELIICVGYPASGKSSFVKTHIVPHGYVYINQDTLKTRDKCVKACKEALANGKSVIIDNTNPEASTRSLYIKLAKEANVPVRCFYFGDNEGLAQHNNYYRALYKSAEKRDVLSIIAYRTFKSRLQVPTVTEGYNEIKHIHFKFESSVKEDIDAWTQWRV